MAKLIEIIPKFFDYIPNDLEYGRLYISEKFKVAIHLCACGCGEKAVTPLKEKEWTLTKLNGKITLRPSIGNFSGEKPYHAHYLITENKIDWC